MEYKIGQRNQCFSLNDNAVNFKYFKEITIEILDDDVFEEDEHFYLHLTNLRMRTADNRVTGLPSFNGAPVACIEMPYAATIMILGQFYWKVCFNCPKVVTRYLKKMKILALIVNGERGWFDWHIGSA